MFDSSFLVAEAKKKAEKETEKETEGAVANSTILARLEAIENGIKAGSEVTKKNAAEKLVDDAIADGKILPKDKTVFLNSAVTDFDGTKKDLDDRKKNSALPGKLNVEKDKENSRTAESEDRRAAFKNSRTDFVDAVKNSGFKIKRDALETN